MDAGEWAVIEPHLPPPAKCGRTRETDLRKVVNAIFYIPSSGYSNGFAAGTLASLAQRCQWRLLPNDFPPYSTVQRYFYAWRGSGLWQTINHVQPGGARSRGPGGQSQCRG
jgi:transposase